MLLEYENVVLVFFNLSIYQLHYKIIIFLYAYLSFFYGRPSILVSDILWQYGEPQSLTTSHQILRRKEAPPGRTFPAPLMKSTMFAKSYSS